MAIKIRLSTLLGERRMSQAELARITNIRPTTIGDWYSDMCVRVKIEHLDLICEALGCEITDLLVRDESARPVLRTKTGMQLKKEKTK